jgi:hypothetical protein
MRLTVLGIAGVASALLSACGEESRKPLPDWSDGYETGGPMAAPGAGGSDGGAITEDGGTVDPNVPPSGTFAIRMASAVRWPLKIRDRDALEDDRIVPCYVEPGPRETELEFAEHKKVRCIIESDELDLHQLGLQYDVIVPEGMCDFLLRVPYIYENFEIGVGPTEVSYTLEEDGSFSDEMNSIDGKPYCVYDYGIFGGDLPNCCYGTYTKTVTSAKTGKVSMSPGTWGGGKLGECYYGGGYLDAEATLDTEGFPVAQTIYVGREALVQHEVFEGPEGKYISNIALANYYDSKDHGGRAPAAIRADFARPNYEYYCLDDAEENIAYIEIVVREWNEEVEFDADGDPDTTGIEPDWELPRTDDINDWTDWKDVDSDGDTFPNLPHL